MQDFSIDYEAQDYQLNYLVDNHENHDKVSYLPGNFML